MSIERRIEQLERLIEPPAEENPEADTARALLFAIVDEVGRLKGSRAQHERGGVVVVPEDIPGQYLDAPYTFGDLVGLACRRVAERELGDDLPADEVEQMVEGWTEGMRGVFERIGKGASWDRIES